MPKSPEHMTDDFEDIDLVQGGAGDLEGFIDAMEAKHDKSLPSPRGGRSGRQRLDDYKESRWLRDQLQDWDDWDEND